MIVAKWAVDELGVPQTVPLVHPGNVRGDVDSRHLARL